MEKKFSLEKKFPFYDFIKRGELGLEKNRKICSNSPKERNNKHDWDLPGWRGKIKRRFLMNETKSWKILEFARLKFFRFSTEYKNCFVEFLRKCD